MNATRTTGMSRDELLQAVKKNGFILRNASASLRDDKEIVMTAVRKTPGALAYASERLQDDYEVVKHACKKSSYAMNFCSNRLRNDRQLRKYSRVDKNPNEAILSRAIGRTQIPEILEGAAGIGVTVGFIGFFLPIVTIVDAFSKN